MPFAVPTVGTSDATWQALIESRVQTVGLPRPSSLDQVRDFTLRHKVQKDLKLHSITLRIGGETNPVHSRILFCALCALCG